MTPEERINYISRQSNYLYGLKMMRGRYSPIDSSSVLKNPLGSVGDDANYFSPDFARIVIAIFNAQLEDKIKQVEDELKSMIK